MARVAIRTGISPADLLDTSMPILAAIVAHLTGHDPLDDVDVDDVVIR